MGKIIAFTPSGTKTKEISRDGQTGPLNMEFENASLSVAWHGVPTTAVKVFYSEKGESGVKNIWVEPNGYPVKITDEVLVVHKSPRARKL